MRVYAARMADGCFEISNQTDFPTPKRIYTIKEPPKHAMAEVNLHAPATCRYIRYKAPDQSWVNISELQCYSPEGKLSGTPFASDKNKSPEELAKICDGNIDTFYAGEVREQTGMMLSREKNTNCFIGKTGGFLWDAKKRTASVCSMTVFRTIAFYGCITGQKELKNAFLLI